MDKFYIENRIQYAKQLELRHNLMIVNRIANIATLAILFVIALITYFRVFG